jgi:hypothetical protein
MALMQDDHVIQACTADTLDQPLDVRILPRTWGGDYDVFDPHVPHSLAKYGAVDAISIAQPRPRSLVPWEGVDDLLCGPLGGGMLRHIAVDDATSMVGQDGDDKEHVACHRRYGKEIKGDQVFDVVVQERLPRR